MYALTCGCTLLLSGSLADLFGCRIMYLTGASLLIAFTMGCGLAKTGIQLIMFRAFSGIVLSFCLPSATSMITKAFPVGRGATRTADSCAIDPVPYLRNARLYPRRQVGASMNVERTSDTSGTAIDLLPWLWQKHYQQSW